MPNYNPQKAIEYAILWWNKRNPLFYNFENLGGDCTNFISQCLYYGGINMTNNWFYYDIQNRSPSWTGVNEFYMQATSSNGNNFSAYTIPIEQVKEGDIVQFCQNGEIYTHTAIVTKKEQQNPSDNPRDNIFITCHSFDVLNKQLSKYITTKIRFLRFE